MFFFYVRTYVRMCMRVFESARTREKRLFSGRVSVFVYFPVYTMCVRARHVRVGAWVCEFPFVRMPLCALVFLRELRTRVRTPVLCSVVLSSLSVPSWYSW